MCPFQCRVFKKKEIMHVKVKFSHELNDNNSISSKKEEQNAYSGRLRFHIHVPRYNVRGGAAAGRGAGRWAGRGAWRGAGRRAGAGRRRPPHVPPQLLPRPAAHRRRAGPRHAGRRTQILPVAT